MSRRLPHILFVSGSPVDRRTIGACLAAHQFATTAIGRGRNALHELETNTVDAVVLDVANDDGSGLEACRRLREKGVLVPIILFTGSGDPIDRVIGLELGADDCIEKPVDEKELVARIRARLRIVDRGHQAADTYSFAGLRLNVKERRVTRPNGSSLRLTSAEFDLLAAFVARAGRKLSRSQLLDLMDRRTTDDAARSIDVLVSRLRRKLLAETDGGLISTIRNGGYQFTSDVNSIRGANAGA
ncbi:response regulator transcription factor [Bradyrhizobium sp. cf659]|uniref:response regulator transcription factor n=1 Tax=Bradyrhizobium sp. cf659 TaxID=1761771 RepID=UPI0008DF51F4|nr:response regulator transcription factor [Bradyrhizobium sp. cf659]SFJ28405.1 two-component system, OmpR family, response regulator [Bradyrhizobium sp. cf659]